MRSLRIRLTSLATFLTLAPLAAAGGVRIVDAAGDGQFPNIQTAVDAAATGDVLLVGPGSYSGFTVDGKGLAIVAAAGGVDVFSAVEIANVPAGEALVLSGLAITALTGEDALRASDCAGSLRFQECSFAGGISQLWSGLPAGTAVVLATCGDVSIARSVLQGGTNQITGSIGGAGLQASDSSFAIHESSLLGGSGVPIETGPTDGGPGCESIDSWFFAGGSEFRGGDGQGDCETLKNGEGGAGLVLDHSATALDCSFEGGIGYGCLPPYEEAPGVQGNGLEVLSGTARSFDLAAASGDKRTISLTVRGEPGDRAYLLASDAPGFDPARELSGAWLIDDRNLLEALPLGVVPPSGTLAVELPLSVLPVGSVREEVFLQGLVRAGGRLILADPSYLLVLNARSTPDCDMDGIQDYVAVLEGSAADTDGDFIPDACEWPGPTWHVDASASAPGTGSPTDPFPSLGLAFAAASDGHTILVADGLYSGAANRDLDFAGRDLVVSSSNGPANCIVDCASAGRAFLLRGGLLTAAVLRGITIRNGDASASLPDVPSGLGGGIFVGAGARPMIQSCALIDCRAYPGTGFTMGIGGGVCVGAGASPTIEGASFIGCSARDAGGGLYLEGPTLVRGCTFIDNEVTVGADYYGGGGIYVWWNPSVIVECVVQGNRSNTFGGGIALMGSFSGSTRVSHCTILENQAVQGGGLALKGDFATLEASVNDCLIAGNVAIDGGGVVKVGIAELRLIHCTFTANDSVTAGAGLRILPWYVSSGGTMLASNCIFWRNAGPNPVQIHNAGPTSLTLRYSDVMGGANGIATSGSGSIALGPNYLSSDPLFADADGADDDPGTFLDNDYRLLPGSPCIDSGSNADVLPDAGDVDGDGMTGEPNPLDLGLQPRFVDDPSIPDTGAGIPPLVDLGAHERQL